jgi:hypothetical protein
MPDVRSDTGRDRFESGAEVRVQGLPEAQPYVPIGTPDRTSGVKSISVKDGENNGKTEI